MRQTRQDRDPSLHAQERRVLLMLAAAAAGVLMLAVLLPLWPWCCRTP